MGDDHHSRQSRRAVLKNGGAAVVGAGFLAGCTGARNGGENRTTTEESSESSTESATEQSESTESASEQTLSATMEPVGTVTFEEQPETVVGEWGFAADVVTALGHGDTIAAMMDPSFWYTGFYEEIPGVPARDNYALPTLGAHDKLNREYVYELDPDLFALDPNRFITSYGLGESDLDAMESGIAPFFGNHSRADRGGSWPNYPSGDSYRYYTIPEYVDKYGELFGEQERASNLVEFYEGTMADIVSNVPDKTPTIALLSAFANPENFGYFGVDDPTPDNNHSTYARKQYHDLGVEDAFAGEYGDKNSESEDLQIDAEKLAAVDPDTIIFREGIRFVDVDESKLTYGNLYEQTLDIINSDPVTSEITAVKEGNLFVGGTDNQGPIINLFQTEMLAKQLYPDTFGEWHGVGETPAEEELVDRDRLAQIITGSA